MSSRKTVISCQGLSKDYWLYKTPFHRLKAAILGDDPSRGSKHIALENVSFSLTQGQVLGVIGRNGAGKSTLLQIICGTLSASTGSIVTTGKIAGLLELGAGFNPELSGTDNIYLYGAILGIDRKVLDEKFNLIVDFAGVRKFIERPVKTYSSGMFVRLAFSIAAQIEPDILIIDEALSVGDGEFGRKSFERIMQLKDSGCAIIFCSHSMYQIEALCDSAIWLDEGKMLAKGSPGEVISAYDESVRSANSQIRKLNEIELGKTPGEELDNPAAKICSVKVWEGNNAPANQLDLVSSQSTVSCEVSFQYQPKLPTPHVAFTIHFSDGTTVCSSSTHLHGLQLDQKKTGGGRATIKLEKFPLLKGKYILSVHLLCEKGIHIYDTVPHMAVINVKQLTAEQGFVQIPHCWSIN